ncbi:hypothetical protein [Nevskia sp.]|uniref:hypothetical protein n=1 Tax=Nevskia sp. TaxID=1929292 RepID=UPI0025D4CC9A|nr:hypothetical protein [Nevskia sp.]
MPDLKRVHYTTGQLLTAADFKAEQDYHREHRQRLRAARLGPGVITGLDLSKTGPAIVKLAVGIAIDNLGRELHLIDARNIDFGTAAGRTAVGVEASGEALNGEYLVTLSHAEIDDPADKLTIGGVVSTARKTERPKLKLQKLSSGWQETTGPSDGLNLRLGVLGYDLASNQLSLVFSVLRDRSSHRLDSQFPALAVTGYSSLVGGVGVGGAVDASNAFAVTGNSTFSGTVNVNQELNLRSSLYVNNGSSAPTLLVTCNSIAARLYTLKNGSSFPPIVLQEGSQSGNVGIGTNAPTAKLHVAGTLRVDGAKTGYVVDHFVNRIGAPVEVGDVVVIGADQPVFHFGVRDTIPVPEVDYASGSYDSRVCGIVCEVVADLVDADDSDEARAAAADTAAIKPARKAAAKKKAAARLGMRALQGERLLAAEVGVVQSGQVGLMVTLGAFAHCKVDADIAPIKAGDLLTTSPTPGHAQKVLDRGAAIGAIVGKALGSLKKGRGLIPVMVMLQ